jgi:hypothetical protein
VHPGLKAPGNDVGAAVAAHLRAALAPERLSRIAFLGIPLDNRVPWQFIAGSVSGGSFAQAPLSGFSPPIMVQSFTGIFPSSGGGFPETPVGPLSVAKLINQFPAIDPSGNPVPRRNAIFGAFDIENPNLSHVLNMDCASCHTAHIFHAPPNGSFLTSSTAGNHSRSQLAGAADLSPARFVPPAGVSGYLASDAFDASGWQVHNLGYFGLHARIGERTLNETATVVELVNRLLAGDGHQNPGLDCGSDRAALDTLYFCQLAASSEAQRQGSFAACVKPAP